jgi:predicted dehydrogenase
MRNLNRRNFLKSSAGAAAGLAAAPKAKAANILPNQASPNDRIRVAIVGLRGRGRSLMKAFHKLELKGQCEVVTLCDCDENVLSERVPAYESEAGKKVQTCKDMRYIMEDESIDVVGMATPNHWHSLGAIWACQAGKDVYVEKPGSHNVFEGRKLIEAAHKYGRIVQHGTQNRSSPNIIEAINQLKNGVIGRVYIARGIAYKKRQGFQQINFTPVPAGLNWDMWQGPAPYSKYAKERHRGWHLIFDYGNGDLGNQGVHELDIIRWGLDLNRHPNKIASIGGVYVDRGEQEYPQVHSTMYQWEGRDVMVSFETRSGFTNAEGGMGKEFIFLDKRNAVGVIFVGTEGYMIIPDYSSYYTFLGKKAEPGPSADAGGLQRRLAVPRDPGPSAVGEGNISDDPHFESFIKAVRSRNESDLRAGPDELHYSSALAHLANISYRTGRMIHFDPDAEKCIGDEDANGLLTRTYREPFVVPDSV